LSNWERGKERPPQADQSKNLQATKPYYEEKIEERRGRKELEDGLRSLREKGKDQRERGGRGVPLVFRRGERGWGIPFHIFCGKRLGKKVFSSVGVRGSVCLRMGRGKDLGRSAFGDFVSAKGGRNQKLPIGMGKKKTRGDRTCWGRGGRRVTARL